MAKAIALLIEHESVVWSIAYHRERNIIATGSANGNVQLWHLDTGKCFGILIGHQEVVMSVDFSADSSLIASGSSDRTIKLWDTDTRI